MQLFYRQAGYRIHESMMRKVQSDKNFAKAGIREKEEINFKGNGKKVLNFINGQIKQFLIGDLYGEIERLFSISEASKLLLGKNISISRLAEHIFELINKNTANKSLLNTFKHLFIIQIFFYKSAEKGQENIQLKSICEEKLIQLMRDETKMNNSTKTSYNILSLIFQSTQRKHVLYSIEKSSKLRSFVDEIQSKILQPFSLYLMKKFQNHQLYARLFGQQALVQQQIWKTLNLSNQLINMIKNTKKLLHYYTSQFQCLFLSFISIICLDLHVFFTKLSIEIGRKCCFWAKQIDCCYQLRSRDYTQYIEKQDQLLLDKQLNQVRNMVQELYEIQGQLLFLNKNEKIKSFFHSFSIPSTWLDFKTSSDKIYIKDIADFSIKMTAKLEQGAKKRKNSADTGISQESFKLFDSLQMPQDLIFEEIN